MANPEQIREMVETFSKATTLISAATSKEDMLAVGMMTIPLLEAHRQMIERMKTSIGEHLEPNLPTSGIMS